jgi:uroporphyrinogen III methyltransferase/synthase
MSAVSGTVHLVGAGPGDPGLISVRGVERLKAADVVVYDALVHPDLLEYIRPEAERIFMGKRAGEPSPGQEAINELLVNLAANHRVVVRLKGGDPFVFGRGGEEALALRAAGIPFEVVPGITAAVAAAAFAGIPVTHRGVSSSVAFVTGHEDPTKEDTDVDWEQLARGVGTVVLYMGVKRMEENLGRLLAAGRAGDTPAAVVQWGTYPAQRTVVGTLDTLPRLAAEAGIGAPAITIVGEVVRLRSELGWFETRPLFGRRIVVTRARAQASELVSMLTERGAEVLQFPTIRVVKATDSEPLRRAVRQADSYDWIVFTSVNGVQRFWSELRAAGKDTRSLCGVSLCAIGPATAAAIEMEGALADLVPGAFVAEGVIEALREAGDLTGRRVLLPRAEQARSILPEALRDSGAAVDEVVAYRTVLDGGGAEEVRRRLREGRVDLITFTASSTVRNFAQLVGTEIGDARVMSIGPITSATARELGLPVHMEAEVHSIPGLIDALTRYAATVGE